MRHTVCPNEPDSLPGLDKLRYLTCSSHSLITASLKTPWVLESNSHLPQFYSSHVPASLLSGFIPYGAFSVWALNGWYSHGGTSLLIQGQHLKDYSKNKSIQFICSSLLSIIDRTPSIFCLPRQDKSRLISICVIPENRKRCVVHVQIGFLMPNPAKHPVLFKRQHVLCGAEDTHHVWRLSPILRADHHSLPFPFVWTFTKH